MCAMEKVQKHKSFKACRFRLGEGRRSTPALPFLPAIARQVLRLFKQHATMPEFYTHVLPCLSCPSHSSKGVPA